MGCVAEIYTIMSDMEKGNMDLFFIAMLSIRNKGHQMKLRWKFPKKSLHKVHKS